VRVTEIFHSIQGESTLAGEPTVFVRFTGCDLRCQYCDTEYAFYGGKQMTRQEILDEVAKYPARFVCLTGGEPTLQKELPQLAQDLLGRGYAVQFPAGWKYDRLYFSDETGATRDGPALQSIYVDFRAHKNAFKSLKKDSSPDMLPQELAEKVQALASH